MKRKAKEQAEQNTGQKVIIRFTEQFLKELLLKTENKGMIKTLVPLGAKFFMDVSNTTFGNILTGYGNSGHYKTISSLTTLTSNMPDGVVVSWWGVPAVSLGDSIYKLSIADKMKYSCKRIEIGKRKSILIEDVYKEVNCGFIKNTLEDIFSSLGYITPGLKLLKSLGEMLSPVSDLGSIPHILKIIVDYIKEGNEISVKIDDDSAIATLCKSSATHEYRKVVEKQKEFFKLLWYKEDIFDKEELEQYIGYTGESYREAVTLGDSSDSH